MFFDDSYIKEVERTDGKIDTDKILTANKQLLKQISNKLDSLPDSRNNRLKKIHDLHKKYVNQAFIKDRFGDLSNQIDKDFKFE